MKKIAFIIGILSLLSLSNANAQTYIRISGEDGNKEVRICKNQRVHIREHRHVRKHIHVRKAARKVRHVKRKVRMARRHIRTRFYRRNPVIVNRYVTNNNVE